MNSKQSSSNLILKITTPSLRFGIKYLNKKSLVCLSPFNRKSKSINHFASRRSKIHSSMNKQPSIIHSRIALLYSILLLKFLSVFLKNWTRFFSKLIVVLSFADNVFFSSKKLISFIYHFTIRKQVDNSDSSSTFYQKVDLFTSNLTIKYILMLAQKDFLSFRNSFSYLVKNSALLFIMEDLKLCKIFILLLQL